MCVVLSCMGTGSQWSKMLTLNPSRTENWSLVFRMVAKGGTIGMLHDSHPGITRMKALARGIVWWPGIDGDLESQVKFCQACQVNRKSPPVTPRFIRGVPSPPVGPTSHRLCGTLSWATVYCTSGRLLQMAGGFGCVLVFVPTSDQVPVPRLLHTRAPGSFGLGQRQCIRKRGVSDVRQA